MSLEELQSKSNELEEYSYELSDQLDLLDNKSQVILDQFRELRKGWDLSIPREIEIDGNIKYTIEKLSYGIKNENISREVLESVLVYVERLKKYFPNRNYDSKKIEEMESYVKAIESVSEKIEGEEYLLTYSNLEGDILNTLSDTRSLIYEVEGLYDTDQLDNIPSDIVERCENMLKDINKLQLEEIKNKLNFIKVPNSFEKEVTNLINQIEIAIEESKKPHYVPVERIKGDYSILFNEIFYSPETLKDIVNKSDFMSFDLNSKEAANIENVKKILNQGNKLLERLRSIYSSTKSTEFFQVYWKLFNEIKNKIKKVESKIKGLSRNENKLLETEKKKEFKR